MPPPIPPVPVDVEVEVDVEVLVDVDVELLLEVAPAPPWLPPPAPKLRVSVLQAPNETSVRATATCDVLIVSLEVEGHVGPLGDPPRNPRAANRTVRQGGKGASA
jgi:hypothetical protein